jgi:predicted nucleic acid-binding protein
VIVVDASAVVEIILNSETGWAARKRLTAPPQPCCAPQLMDLEVMHVLRRGLLSGLLTLARAEEALADLRAFRIKRCSHLPLLPRIWELRHNFSVYDAAYVALAEEFSATLLTCDARLASASGHRARIEVV